MKKKDILLAPSLLAADFSCLKNSMKAIEKWVDLWHIDVMDGCFVPNISLGPFIVAQVNNITDLPLDVHLMIQKPLKYAQTFIDVGADYITAHIEAFDTRSEVMSFIDIAKVNKVKVGLSLKPNTQPESLLPYLKYIDLVLVMTVEPGFGGQKFMANQLSKILWFKERFPGLISVDGGITHETAIQAVSAGASLLVSGSYIFGSNNPRQAISLLRSRNDKDFH